MLQKELDFLEKLSVRAAGGIKEPPVIPCEHSEEISRLFTEKEHFFFKRDITDEYRNQIMQEIDEDIKKISRTCTCDK
jgi:hypothetical protein